MIRFVSLTVPAGTLAYQTVGWTLEFRAANRAALFAFPAV